MTLPTQRPLDGLDAIRASAFEAGQYIGQENFMTADRILALAQHAHIGPDTHVLDVCCGAGGAGSFLTRRLGCSYDGVDRDATSIAHARERSLPCRFHIAQVPPLPSGDYDVVLLLETLLAFEDKRELFGEIAACLSTGGRFAGTAEIGAPLTAAEREQMPASNTVWPIEHARLKALFDAVGLEIVWQRDESRHHAHIAGALADAYAAHYEPLVEILGLPAAEDTLTAHRLWCSWLTSGRISKYAFVARG